LVVSLLFFLATPSSSTLAATSFQDRPIPGQQPTPQEDEGAVRMRKDMEKKANSERHAALKRDTDKLLELAQQLKDNVDKSNENTLSLDVVKKAEEIEKLAHSVREKMKGY
jgi:phage-related tail protein